MCPSTCDLCGETLDDPYSLPCRLHYVCPCCKDVLQESVHNEQAEELKCAVDNCSAEITAEFVWKVDTVALENR